MALRVEHPRMSSEEFGWLAATYGWNFPAELIEGVAVLTPPDGPLGSAVGLELTSAVRAWQQSGGGGRLLPNAFILIDTGNVLGPDLAWWGGERGATLNPGRMSVTPDWVAEVLSPSTRHNDLGPKRDAYLRNGVREYWIVDPEQRLVSVVDAGGANVVQAGKVRSTVLEGFAVDVATLFDV